MGLRDKYKATRVTTLKDRVSKEDKMIGSDGGRAGYLSITEGTNKFRLFPAHPGSELFYGLKVVHWGNVAKEDGSLGRKPVFNAKVHGGLKHDIFEEYLKAAKTHLEESGDDEAAAKIKAMTDWKTGIGHSNSWLCYALKIEGDQRNFGLLEFSKLVRDGLNKVAAFEDEDAPIEVDPFTDPDEGVPVTIVYTPKSKTPAGRYDISLGRKPKAMPLTDEELEEFEGKTSIAAMLEGVYRMKDFELALECINNFDDENDIGFADSDAFEEIVAKCKAEVEVLEEGGGKSKKAKSGGDTKPAAKTGKKKVEEPADEEEEQTEDEAEEDADEDDASEGDKFVEMDRTELKQYIASNDLAETVRVKKSMSDDDIREAIRTAEASADTEEAGEDEDEEEEAPKSTKKDAPTGVSKLAAIKDKLRRAKEGGK